MALVLGAMGAVVLWRTLPFLGPVPPEGLYNSDSAIPVLMSNLATGAPVDWLFWGQDRFGSWPFLLARAGGALVGRAWTPHAMHVLRTLWMTAALWPWIALAGRAGVVAGAGLLLLPALNPLLGSVLTDLGTVDGWQLPALLWAWWGLRRASRGERAGGWLALAAVAAALASWTSLVSAPLLLMLGLLEGAGARAPGRRRALLVVPAFGGALVEWGVRTAWHAAIRARGWRDVRTPARLDAGHLVENLGQVARVAWSVEAVPWLVAALACAAVALVAGRARPWDSGRGTVVGAGAGCATSLLVVVAVRHVRDNAYAPRYLGVGLALAVLGVSVAAGLLVRALVERRRPQAGAGVLAALALAALVLGVPRAGPDPRESVLRPAAEEIGRRFPGAVYVGGYWWTYALAALLPPWTVIPVPREGEWNRRPDWAASLRSGRPVLVGRPDVETGPPPASLVAYGTALVLAEPDVVVLRPLPGESTGERLSLYRPASEGD